MFGVQRNKIDKTCFHVWCTKEQNRSNMANIMASNMANIMASNMANIMASNMANIMASNMANILD